MIRVGPDLSRPTHHVKLSRDGVEIGLILCDSNGNADETAMRRDNMPDSAIKMYSGESTHADAEPPFRPIEQKDWSGGRGNRIFEDAADRYYDAGGLDASKAGKLFLAGQNTYTQGMRNVLMYMPGSVSYLPLYGTTRFRSMDYTVGSSGWTCGYIETIVYFVGDPGTLTLAIYSDNAGSPGSLLASTTANNSGSQRMPQHIRLNLTRTLTASTTYHFVIYGASTDNEDNHWEVGVGSGYGMYSSNGSTWGGAGVSSAPYNRIVEGTTNYHLRFFEYKRAFYAVKVYYDGQNSLLYRCGSRGVAQSNSGNMDKLIDVNQINWFNDSEVGKIAMIYKGPGSDELQPWREIEGNTTTQLEVYPSWGVTHTTSTEYVVFGDRFYYLRDLGGNVTDIAITDDYVYFARGEGTPVLRYQEYNNGGVWTTRTGTEGESARHLAHIYHPSLGPQLYGTRNEHPAYRTSVFRAQIPKAWGNFYQDLGEAFPTNSPWDTRQITSVTPGVQSQMTKVDVAAGFTTGVIAVQDLAEPVDISRGEYLGVLVKSSLDLSAGDLRLYYDDQPNLSQQWAPTGTFLADFTADPPTYEDMPRARDGNWGSYEEMIASASRRVITSKSIYIFHTEPFNKISVYMGTPVNAAAATLSVLYFNGNAWNDVNNLVDGTANSGATLGKAGDITFDQPYNWAPCTVNNIEGYAVQLRVSADLTDGIKIQLVRVGRENTVAINFPALTANVEAWVRLAITPSKWPMPDEHKIKSVGLGLTTDVGALTLTMRGGIRLMSAEPVYKELPAGSRIMGIKEYAGSTDDLASNPWIFTDSGNIYEMQTQNDDQLVPLALSELKTLQSESTGKAATTQGLYLWFSLGKDFIQRYYNHQIDNMGYNREEGLPMGRRGSPAKMITWTDNILVAVDGGEEQQSSVMLYNGRGWHEVYRAPKWGLRILDLAVQVIPGQVDRLWIDMGGEAIYMPISVNPLEESGYQFRHFGYLVTSIFTGGMQDVIKYIHSIKLATEFLSTDWYTIEADYKLAGDTSWTMIDGNFNVSPYDELPLSANNDITSRWVSLRFRFFTRAANTSPIMYGSVLQTMMFSQVKFVYTMTFRLKDKDVDLLGDRDSVGFKDKFDQLDAWVKGALPVLFNSNSQLDNGAYVFPGPTPVRRLRVIKDPNSHEETHICQMTLIGI